MARKILNIATGGLIGRGPFGRGLIWGGKKKPKETPAPVADPVMPTPDDDAIRQARRRSIIQQMGRRGRASTILTGDSDKLGG